MIERIVAAQVKVFLSESDLMLPVQSAYLAGHSTESSVLEGLSDTLHGHRLFAMDYTAPQRLVTLHRLSELVAEVVHYFVTE